VHGVAAGCADTLADSPGTTPSGISCRSAKICTISLTLSPWRSGVGGQGSGVRVSTPKLGLGLRAEG